MRSKDIATIAYGKWEAAGKPDGMSDRFWFEAEAELQQLPDDDEWFEPSDDVKRKRDLAQHYIDMARAESDIIIKANHLSKASYFDMDAMIDYVFELSLRQRCFE